MRVVRSYAKRSRRRGDPKFRRVASIKLFRTQLLVIWITINDRCAPRTFVKARNWKRSDQTGVSMSRAVTRRKPNALIESFCVSFMPTPGEFNGRLRAMPLNRNVISRACTSARIRRDRRHCAHPRTRVNSLSRQRSGRVTRFANSIVHVNKFNLWRTFHLRGICLIIHHINVKLNPVRREN